jgi:hypothetical protein
MINKCKKIFVETIRSISLSNQTTPYLCTHEISIKLL